MTDSEVERFDPRPNVKASRLNILPENPDKNDLSQAVGLGRFPSWLHRKMPSGSELQKTGAVLNQHRLHTVCEEAKCPNLLECWSKKTATFLILGKECTRSCGFCDIQYAKQPAAIDADEPERVAQSACELGLKHIVITMVARDDLPDGGASHLINVMLAVRKKIPEATIEVLTSDFLGNESSLETVLRARPEIFNHNIETVRELTPRVRHTATYERTLHVLRFAKQQGSPGLMVKSGMMLGLGETEEQIKEALHDLHDAGCDIVTLGQYLQASHRKLRVKAFIHPDTFQQYQEYGHQIGIKFMYCGPFVRSSYNANLVIKMANNKIKIINSD
jgi:lipoic acid synthetase